ncbi:uncharacterized protein VP01_2680g1 [Puccinia sorghi]|uniref:Uncharacterized protein n=1 Tax=Puccinia sorghi TaxID=27349 RepID=A0A0L6V3T5_9BASI|nr:uncharacterized protein VP01_2680g1 [Puccinia sorghi]
MSSAAATAETRSHPLAYISSTPCFSLFQSETRKIIWVAQHFGFKPLENCKTPALTENWFSSLLLDNACRAGIVSQYVDLDGVDFTLPVLASVEAFLSKLVTIFGDKFSKENAKLEDVEANRIDQYVDGLNPRIIHKAMSNEWRSTPSDQYIGCPSFSSFFHKSARSSILKSSTRAFSPLPSNRHDFS